MLPNMGYFVPAPNASHVGWERQSAARVERRTKPFRSTSSPTSTTMATFSDGGDVFTGNMRSGSPSSTHSSAGDMRFYLQTLLDNKEKQLQQAGTLGQQLLAQRMELEERIRQLQDFDLETFEDESAEASIRGKYRDLAETIKGWDVENEQLSGVFTAKVGGISKCDLAYCMSNIHIRAQMVLKHLLHHTPWNCLVMTLNEALNDQKLLQVALLQLSHLVARRMQLIVLTTLVSM